MPNTPHEGKSEESMLPMDIQKSDSLKRKQIDEDEKLLDPEPRKTRGIQTNYHYLNDPFPDKEETEQAIPMPGEIYTAFAEIPSGGDEPKSLAEGKRSPEWPEWECAVQSELDQLQQMGTWILVDKPVDTVPISNKWVFIKKYSKLRELLKHKARLVAKGCLQQPGHDYAETFSLVVCLETIRAILALVPSK